jgi:hypothetical protein
MLTLGVGGCFDYKITDYFMVGAGIGIYNMNFEYPLVRDSSEILQKNASRTTFGFYTGFSLNKNIGKFALGASMNVYIIGKQESNYYYYYPYEPNLVFPAPLQGIGLNLNFRYSL